jgi:hypothetical protein
MTHFLDTGQGDEIAPSDLFQTKIPTPMLCHQRGRADGVTEHQLTRMLERERAIQVGKFFYCKHLRH